MNYNDVKTIAKEWRVSERRVHYLCKNNQIPGVVKEKGQWYIPVGTEKPADRRYKNNQTVIHSKLPLPIGVSNYKSIIENYYYVDKTLLIKDVLDTKAKVSLFTRPRRFGKTLMMDMVKTYFEISLEDTSKYFTNTNIWKCGKYYKEEQGKYPVIYITFKDIKFKTWQEAKESIKKAIQIEYNRHRHILSSSLMSDFDRNYYFNLLNGDISDIDLVVSLVQLSRILKEFYSKEVIVIIDEYDTPIQQGYIYGYYDDIIMFMRNLFSGVFKDNNYLAYGFLTGILRVAKESIFSGLNNLKVNSVLEERYSSYFGFTKDEVKQLLIHYKKEDKLEEICHWYDGYAFGNTEIFNPWSVLNYLDENCIPKAYWQYTGDNSIIKEIIQDADYETIENLHKLMKGNTITSYIDTSVIYPEIKNNPTTIYSFLLSSGYLKTVTRNDLYDGNSICELAIPNKEIFSVYEKEILSAYSNIISQSSAIAIQQAILTQNIKKLQSELNKFLIQSISSFDYANESFYHGIMLGICAIMNNLYIVESNRESGLGRFDIQLKPINKQMPGIIIEIKASKNKDIKELSILALNQINEKEYITNMKNEGITSFMKIGIAFYKKNVEITSELI